MALNKDILGLALYNRRQAFCDLDYDQIITAYGTMEAARLAMAKADAEEIINHFKANVVLTIPGLGLNAGAVAVTGSSITGSMS